MPSWPNRAELSVSNTTKSHVIFYPELKQGLSPLQPPTVVISLISVVLLEAGISDERQTSDSDSRASPNMILKMTDDPPTSAPATNSLTHFLSTSNNFSYQNCNGARSTAVSNGPPFTSSPLRYISVWTSPCNETWGNGAGGEGIYAPWRHHFPFPSPYLHLVTILFVANTLRSRIAVPHHTSCPTIPSARS